MPQKNINASVLESPQNSHSFGGDTRNTISLGPIARVDGPETHFSAHLTACKPCHGHHCNALANPLTVMPPCAMYA